MKFLLTFFMALALPALARIGETEVECMKRYGSPLEEPSEMFGMDKALLFEDAGFSILVGFHHGRAEVVIYTKIADESDVIAETISPAEGKKLRESNGGGMKWTGYAGIGFAYWIREDAKVTADHARRE
jgi:hypothetical protein